MNDRQLTIPKTPELDTSENYSLLRDEGLKFIERLSSKIWTDYNIHDPGITIMELLCYAITDLGYRTSFPIEDLLARRPGDISIDKDFYTAAEVLPVNPTTENDLRKIIIDVKGVKNAWISTAKSCEAPVFIDNENCELTTNPAFATGLLALNGLFNILLQYETPGDGKEESELSADEKTIRANAKELIRQEVYNTVMQHRNLCEDLLGISEVNVSEIAICADVEVRQNADINLVMAKIYQIAINYCSPSLNFYTMEEMLDKGYTIDEIFEGPLLKYGFLDTEEVENANLREELHTSDLINSIMDIEDVVAVRSFKLLRYEDGILQEPAEPWVMKLIPGHAAQFSRVKSKLIFYKGLLPFMAKQDEVLIELNRLQQSSGRFRKTGQKMDIDVPTGTWRELDDYFPVQNDFPMVYGIGQTGLPESADPMRKAQAKQLKAYLLFFEQLLTNYLAQLANTNRLFSSRETVDRRTLTVTGRSYYTQLLKNYPVEGAPDTLDDAVNGISDLRKLINFGDYKEELDKLAEDEKTFADRRNRFLDHLLSRFCESMSEYSLILFHQLGNESGSLRLIADKEAFLRDYILLSRDRGRACNYKKRKPSGLPLPAPAELPDVWDTTNISGLKVRIARMLGMAGVPVEDENDSYLRVISTGTNKWKVQLVNNNGTVLLTTSNFTTYELAEKRYHEIRESGMLASNFETDNDTGFALRLLDTGSAGRELAYQFFDTAPERDAAKVEAIAMLNEDIIIDNIRRRSIATDMFTIKTSGSGSSKRWWVEMKAPREEGGPQFVFLNTIKEDSAECAESHLLYLLHSGDDEDNYRMFDDDTANKYSYGLFNECDTEIPMANGPVFATAEERNKAFSRLLFLFRDKCDIEDFHLLEHILLRPRIQFNNNGIPFEKALTACQSKDLKEKFELKPAYVFQFIRNESIVKKTAAKTTSKKKSSKAAVDPLVPVNYAYTIRILKYEKIPAEEKANELEKGKENYIYNVFAESAVTYEAEACKELLATIRNRGMAASNFKIIPDDAENPSSYSFELLNFQITSTDKKAKTAPTFILKNFNTFSSEATIKKELEALSNWFAFKETWWNDYIPATCEIPDDPYSFRMSFILPAWPTRFRSSYFRQYIERTIRQETPAHIYVKICWVGLQQMRDFETAYKPWLESLNQNLYPEADKTNKLIDEMSKLYNVYPTAILHSCDDISADEPQMILDQTTLGNQ
jgi:hypothetical protein